MKKPRNAGDGAANEKGTRTHRYPLELVARLAIRLIANGNFDGAAKRAIGLLDACAAVLEGRGKPPVTMLEADAIHDMEWEEFVQYLTKVERRDRAEPKVNDYFKFEIQKRKAETLAEQKLGTRMGPVHRAVSRERGIGFVPVLLFSLPSRMQ